MAFIIFPLQVPAFPKAMPQSILHFALIELHRVLYNSLNLAPVLPFALPYLNLRDYDPKAMIASIFLFPEVQECPLPFDPTFIVVLLAEMAFDLKDGAQQQIGDADLWGNWYILLDEGRNFLLGRQAVEFLCGRLA